MATNKSQYEGKEEGKKEEGLGTQHLGKAVGVGVGVNGPVTGLKHKCTQASATCAANDNNAKEA